MHFALIVATIGRDAPLELLFSSLVKQFHKQFRVILVDQNQDQRLEPLVKKYCNIIEILHLAIPPRGVSQARNYGLMHLATEELIAFPDDDCHFDDWTLSSAAVAFSCRPEIDIIMGSLHLPGERLTVFNVVDISDMVVPICSRTKLFRAGGTVVQFFRRRVVDAVGGFDELLGPGAGTPWLSGEDSDYLVRAAKKGTVARCPAVRIYHPAVDGTGPGYQRKAIGYGRGRIRLLRKNRFPLWFILANIVHPLLTMFLSRAAHRRFKFFLFIGRIREFILPYKGSQ